MIDSHAHIYVKDFADDREEMMARAVEAGVEKIFMPNIDIESVESMLAMAEAYPEMCYPMIGLHPCSVDDTWESQLNVLFKYLEKVDCIAIGEIGIDLHWDVTFKEEQIKAFQRQTVWAIDRDLPIVIHSRNSIDLIIDLLEEWQIPGLRGVFHCFGGNEEQATRIQNLGFMMGIGGVVTFKNSNLREVLPHINPQHLLLETDAPYLAPTPLRGKRNEPSYLSYISDQVAKSMGLSKEAIAKITSDNANQLFLTNTK